MNRADAYEGYMALKKKKVGGRNENLLKGLGPAYFTKLIYFLMPQAPKKKFPAGCIMDQWAACSINLLCPERLVYMNANFSWKSAGKGKGLKMISSFSVSDRNTGVEYECFCHQVDLLATHFSKSVAEIDRSLISTESKKPKVWRKHVLDYRYL